MHINRKLSFIFAGSLLLGLLLIFNNVPFGFASASTPPGGSAAKVKQVLESKTESNELYSYKVTVSKHTSHSGRTREFTIYVPDINPNLPKPPFPTVLMAHGFLMTAKQQKENGEYFARRGMVVIAPNITKLLLGEETRMNNIDDILDLLKWLTTESSYKEVIDVNRFAVGGNSSGGAVALELLIQMQKRNLPCRTACFLDGVPWDRSWAAVKELKPVNALTLRAEDTLCNEKARMLKCLAPIPYSFDDVKIVGAHHCDAEAPTTIGCLCVCGKSDPVHRARFQRVLYLYLRDTLEAHNFETPAESFADLMKTMQKEGTVEARLTNLESHRQVEHTP
jgi:acetyl esterase/lipase